jgi:hypothetical protein
MDEHRRSPTRSLTSAERALLDHLLEPEFDGVAVLREQAARAEVVLQEEFPRSIELHVPADAPPATNVYRNPVTRTVTADPTRSGADITLWVDGDYLDRIEVMWLDEEWPDLPSPDELHAATVM